MMMMSLRTLSTSLLRRLSDMMDLYKLRCCIDTIAWQLEYLEAAVVCDSPLMMESCRDHINSCLSEMTAEGVLI